MPEQLSLNFEPSPEDRYKDSTDQELLDEYALKVKVSLRHGRHMIAGGKIDRNAVIQAILNPEKEREELRIIDQEYDKIGDVWSRK